MCERTWLQNISVWPEHRICCEELWEKWCRNQGRTLARRERLMTSVARENLVKMKTEERLLHLMIRKSYQRASEVGDWSRNGCKQRHWYFKIIEVNGLKPTLLFERKVPPYTRIQWFYFMGGRQFSISEGKELIWREKKKDCYGSGLWRRQKGNRGDKADRRERLELVRACM